MRKLFFVLIALLAAAPAAAQGDPDMKVAGGGQFPEGWQARVDRDQPDSLVVFTREGEGFHAVMGPAAVFYNPSNAKSGDYRVSARFTQTQAPRHAEAYGIVIGGDDLDEPDQKYTYFLVRKDGQYFIATRNGDERTVVAGWTPHEAVQKEEPSGRQVNVLGAQVQGNEVIFTVNGTEVARRPKDGLFTEGYWGFRVNHNLDVVIDQVSG